MLGFSSSESAPPRRSPQLLCNPRLPPNNEPFPSGGLPFLRRALQRRGFEDEGVSVGGGGWRQTHPEESQRSRGVRADLGHYRL